MGGQPDRTRMTPETVIHVTDRTWESMKNGAELERWPGESPPVGERVTVFDSDMNFTQHDVKQVVGSRVWIGPAIPWESDGT